MLKRWAVIVAVVCVASGLVVRTPALGADEFAVGATNVALAANGGHIVAFSSHILDENKQPVKQWQVSNVIDGIHVTATERPRDSYGWSSAVAPTPAAPQWFVIAFQNQKTRLITRVRIDPTTDDPAEIGRWAKDFKILVSNTTEEGPWVEVKSGRLLNKGIPQTFDFPPVECRFLKVAIVSNWFSDQFVELGEVEVYEAIATGDTLEQLIIRLDNLLQDLKRYRDSQRYNQPLRPELKPTTAPGGTTTGPVEPAPKPTAE
jgi:hypothetical protein